MNSKLFLIALLINVNLFSQVENFSVKNNYITWEKEFNSNLTPEEIKTALEANPALRNIAEKFKGPTNLITKNCSTSGTAIFMRDDFKGYTTIDKTDSGYLVKVDGITFLDRLNIS